MLTTSIPLSAAYVSASTVGCRKKKPESCPARMLTSVTFGATPAIPSPFSAAPIEPATCVPCPSSSSFAGSTQLGCSHGPSMDGMSVTKLRERAASKFGARSGWVPSTPVSRIPTRTPLSPGCFEYEPPAVAWSIAMSHWSEASGSADRAAREACVPFFAFAALNAAVRSAAVSCSTTSTFGVRSGALPIGTFRAAPTSAAWAAASVTKLRLADMTVATPTDAFSFTIVPRTARTAARAEPSEAPSA